MKRWMLWGAIAFLILAGGGWTASRMIARASAEPARTAKTILSTTELPPSERMQQMLMDPRLDAAARESLMEKIDIAKQAEQDQLGGSIPRALKVAPDFGSEPQIKGLLQIETGIFPGSEGMIRPSQAQINNYWQGIIDGQIVMVFAGAAADDQEQGLVVVATTNMDPNASDIHFEMVLVADKAGSLRVASETGGILALQNPEGTETKFDLSAKTFLP